MLLSLDNVGIQRSEKWLVRGVSMDINPGEIVPLLALTVLENQQLQKLHWES